MGRKPEIEKFNEMRRLYEEERKSLREIADRFGVSWQAVHQGLKKYGVKMRPKGTKRLPIDREVLQSLYVERQITITEIARRLETTYNKVAEELDRYGIEKRSAYFSLRKYPQLYEIQVGEKLVIPRPEVTNIYRNLYEKAGKAGIRISIRSIDAKTIEITRVS